MRDVIINNTESEAGLLATLINKPEWYFYSEHLLPNHFANIENQCMYTAIKELVLRGIYTIDPYNILEVLNASDATRKHAECLNIGALQDFFDLSPGIARNSVEEYKLLVQNILDAAFRRDALRVLDECKGLCTDLSKDDIRKQVYEKIDGIMNEYSVGDDIVEFRDVVDELWNEIEEHQDGKYGGIPFKFPTLNEFVRIEPGELVVVGAPAKGAKSMFMLNEAVDILKQGKSVFYLDSELSSRLFLCRMVSHLTGIEFSRVRSGRYNEEENARIKEAIAWVKEQKLVHLYLPIFQTQTIYTAVKKVHHRFNGLDVLIVDYLKSTGEGDAYTIYNELGKLTDLVKNELCGNLGIAGLAAAQLTASNKLADSAKIARNASTIMLLTDKTIDERDEDGEEGGNKKIIVVQNRNGMQHVDGEWINIDFNGNICLLEEAKKMHIPELPY